MDRVDSNVLLDAVSNLVDDAEGFQFSSLDASVNTQPVSAISIGNAPEFVSTMPSLAEITLPNPLAGSPPSAPSLDAIDVPNAPDIIIPEPPTLLSLDIPVEPVLDLPVFDALIGQRPVVPESTFTWDDAAYTSTLMTNLALKQSEFILGAASALPDDVEQRIVEKVKDAVYTEDQVAVRNAAVAAGSSGFSQATGTQVRQLYSEFRNGLSSISERSRELMTEQIRLEQENMAFSMINGIQQQAILLNDNNLMQQRILDAAQVSANSKIDLFNAQLQLIKTDVAVFALLANVFRENLKAQLARLDVFKAQLQASQARAELDVSAVELYVAELDGVKAKVDVFKSTVDAARAKATVDLNNVDLFRTKIEGVKSQLQSQKAEVSGFAAQVKAESLEFDAFKAKANVFKSNASVFKTLVDANVAQQTAEFNQNQRVPLEKYKVEVDKFKATALREGSRAEAIADRQQAMLSLVRAQIDKSIKTGRGSIDTQAAKGKKDAAEERLKNAVSDAKDRIKVAGASVKAAVSRSENQAAAMKEAAVISQESVNTSNSTSLSTSVSTSKSLNTAEIISCEQISSSGKTVGEELLTITTQEGAGVNTDPEFGPNLGNCRAVGLILGG